MSKSTTLHDNENKVVFATVGATAPFADLVDALLQDELITLLEELCYTELRIQHGGVSPALPASRIRITSFPFTESIRDEMHAAAVIISHAGGKACNVLMLMLRIWLYTGSSTSSQETHRSGQLGTDGRPPNRAG